MSNRAWMPLHVDVYLADTGHLTTLEHGAYLMLIMHYWRNGGLPEDERMIARIARLSKDEWAESRDVMAALFREGWRHKRIDDELAKADEIIGKRKAAAEAMHNKRNANAEHVQSKCSDTHVPPLTDNHTSSLRSEVKRVPRDELREVLDEEHSQAVIEHRQRISKPLTTYAAKKLAVKLAKCTDPNAAADEMISNGWQGFKPEWLEGRTQRGQAPPGRQNAADAYRSIVKERTNEPSSIRGNRGDVEFLPPGRSGLPSPPEDLLKTVGGSFGRGDH